MSRISPATQQNTSERSQQLLDGVQAKLGMTPNMMSTMAHSAATLDAYLKFSDALGKGYLKGKTREKIALAIGQTNSCQYCLSAHSAIGKMVGLSVAEIRDARMGTDDDAKTDAILKFAKRIVDAQGQVNNDDIDAARNAGLSDAELTEVVANTALNLLTNYFNHVADTEIDFPVAEDLNADATCSTGCAT